MTLTARRTWTGGDAAHLALEDLSRRECLDLLATVSVGRLGVSIDALPAVLPVNFVVHNDAIVLRSAPGTKLDAALRQKVVAFEADSWSEDGLRGWSVLVRGVAVEIEEPDLLAAVHALPLHAWPFPADPQHYVIIATTLVSGRRFDHSTPRAA
jgi:uncharacterized protein